MKQPVTRRLPAPSPAMLLVLARWSAERDKRGSRWCRENLVGTVRKHFDRPTMRGNVTFMAPSVEGTTLEESAEQCRELLRLHCAICNSCSLAK